MLRKVGILLCVASVGLALPQDLQSIRNSFGKAPTSAHSPLPGDVLAPSDLPVGWDWRHVNGTNFVTVVRNQHVPQYCGSCWAFAATTALSSRIKIARQAAWPDAALNCVSPGSCGGGVAGFVYAHAKDKGLPEESCAPYEAAELPCDGEGICKDCEVYATKKPTCFAVPPGNFTLIKVKEHGEIIESTHHMKAEIYQRGPIACLMSTTPEMHHFSGSGVFSQRSHDPLEGLHWVSIVGWTAATKTEPEAWVVQNSWGSYWAEHGFFRIKLQDDNLFINTECAWAVPEIPKELE